MNVRASEVVINLVQAVLLQMEPIGAWERTFIRFHALENEKGMNGSYQTAGGVYLIGAIRHADFYAKMFSLFEELLAATETSEKLIVVCLLTVSARAEYTLAFEYDDPSKWKITKLDGGTGIPAGLAAQICTGH